MKVLAISVVNNMAAGLLISPLIMPEVSKSASEPNDSRLFTEVAFRE